MSTNWPPYGSMPAPFGLSAQQQQQPQAPLPFEQPGLANPYYPPALPAYGPPYNINYQAYAQNAPQLQYPPQPYQTQYQSQQPLQNQHWTSANPATNWRGPTYVGSPPGNEQQRRPAFQLGSQGNQEADENTRKQKNAEEIFRSEPDFNTAIRTIRDLARQFPTDFPRFDTPPTFDKNNSGPSHPAPPASAAQNASLTQPVPPSRSSPGHGGPPLDTGVRDGGSERMDVEMEDGEVSEGGQGHGVPTKDTSRLGSQAQPVAPNQTAELPHAQTRAPPGSISTTPMLSGTANSPVSDTTRDLAAQREEARHFIRLLHKHNIGSGALANEGLDTDRLRDLYRSTGLPFEAASSRVGPQANNGAASTPSTNATAAPTTVAPATDPRAQYVARLQAAKRAKTSPTAATPKETAPAAPPAQLPLKPTVDVKEVDPQVRARTTEMIRQRIKELENFKKQGNTSSHLPSRASTAATPMPASQGASLTNPVLNSTRSDNPSPPQGATSVTFSTIPGLFMNAPSAAPPALAQVSAQNNVANRPLDSGSAAQSLPINAKSQEHAKPPSNPGSEPPKLDGSDGENEGSEMDLSDGNSVNRLTESPSATHHQEPGSQPSVIPQSLPSQTPTALPGLAASSMTSMTSQTPSSQTPSQQMDDKQQALLRAKAAARSRLREVREEREKKALAARAVQQPSNAASPAQPLETSNSGSGTPLDKAVPPPDVARGSRKRRREEIESDLPLLDADYATNSARIAQLTRELEALAAHNAKIEQDRERLKRELEGLGVDTEGLPHAELQAKMNEIDRGREAGLNNGIKDSSLPIQDDAASHSQSQADAKSPAQSLGKTSKADVQRTAPESGVAAPVQPLAIPGLGSSFVSQLGNVQQPSPQNMASASGVGFELASSTSAAVPDTHQPSPLSATETNGKPVQESHPTPGDDDDDDFYSPVPASDGQAVTAMEVQRAASLSEEGEVAMSESEGEYEPEEPAPVPQWPAIETQLGEPVAVPSTFTQFRGKSPSTSSSSSSGSDSGNESEDLDGGDAHDSDANEEAMDISSSSGSSPSSSTSPPGHESPGVIEPGPNNSTAASAADFGAESAAVTTAAANGQEPNQGDDMSVAFVPYESPLKIFKSFRFHPNYAEFVPSGYNSLTFSHSIDPFQEVCPTDLSGTDCNDPHCPYQHFRSMSVDGETLLVQLGTANPGKSDAERKRWIEGMQALLKDIRTRNVQGFENVAKEIGKFRREFLGSDDRVLGI